MVFTGKPHAGRMVFHGCARAVAFILHAERNEIAGNFIAPLLVEMQEKLCGLRLAAKYELALRGIIINLLQFVYYRIVLIGLYCLYLHYIFLDVFTLNHV